MSRRLHFPTITEEHTGYGVTWLPCLFCNKDKSLDKFTDRSFPPKCDECRAEEPTP
jgi:hypothetical protein